MKLFINALSFASKKHSGQTRINAKASPYIIHPIDVVEILSSLGSISDEGILAAAVLHDTVEDTDTTPEELTLKFGKNITKWIIECSDDKGLPKERRKELQIEHAPTLTTQAKLIKLADKISNLMSILSDPPAKWNNLRKLDYFKWSEKVINGLRGVNPELEREADRVLILGFKKLTYYKTGSINDNPTRQIQ